MGYSVEITGRIRFAPGAEDDAFTTLRNALQNHMHLDVDDLVELAAVFHGYATRQDDEFVFVPPDRWVDRKWNTGCNIFYGTLGRWATGHLDVVGEDGATWSYDYAEGDATQWGTNGWDGTTQPISTTGGPALPTRVVVQGGREPAARRPRRIVGAFTANDDNTAICSDLDAIRHLTSPRPEFGPSADADGLRFAVMEPLVQDRDTGPLLAAARGTAAEHVLPRIAPARRLVLVDCDRLTDDRPLRALAARLDAVMVDGPLMWWFDGDTVVEVKLSPDDLRPRARRSVSGGGDPSEL